MKKIVREIKRELIIEPLVAASKIIGYDLCAKSGANLVLGTVAKESQFKYLRQHGFDLDSNKGAFGLWQIELETHSLVTEWLRKNKEDLYCFVEKIYHPDVSVKLNLMYNFAYSCLICRSLYLSINKPLPEKGDIEEMAKYWSLYYNRKYKEGTPEELNRRKEFIVNYEAFCL